MSDRRSVSPIYDRLSKVMFGHRSLSFVNDWKYVPLRERRRLLREVDDLHRTGSPWPKMWDGKDRWFWFTPRVEPEESRRPTSRPDHLPYCLEWSGAYWRPINKVKQRRVAGYLPLPMTWPPPLPKAGSYLVNRSGRGRLAYRICEVERFDKPRGQHRFTCRLWCERLLLDDIPKGAKVHRFYWHSRRKQFRRIAA